MKILKRPKARLLAGFMAATVAICTLPFFIAPVKTEAAVISSNYLVSEEDVRAEGYTTEKAFRDSILAACEQMDGVKYQWGGSGSNGIDCAGSVSLAYSAALGTAKITGTSGSYGNKTVSYTGGGNPDKYGFYWPGYAGIRSSFKDGILKEKNISPSENHFSSFDTNGTKGIQSDEWKTIISTYDFRPGDMIMWWNDDNDSNNAQHITIYAGIENGVPMHWTASSSAGYFCKKALADSSAEAGKGSFTGFMALRSTRLIDDAYVGFYLDKSDPSKTVYTGCIFTVYQDGTLKHEAGQLRDDDGNGIYTDYYSLNKSTGAYTKELIKLTRKDDNDVYFEDRYFIKETSGPKGAILSDGTTVSFTDKDGNVPEVYNFIDDTIYRIDMKVSGIDGNTGKLEYAVSVRNGDTLYSTSDGSYSYNPGSAAIVVTNMPTTDSTCGRGKGAGLFTDASSLELEKITSSDVDTESTVFTLTEGDDLAAVYKCASGKWNWYDKDGNVWGDVSTFPVKYGTEYTVTEKFSKSAPFKCIDGSTIDYEIRNDSGWEKVDDTTYKYSFKTDDLSSLKTYSFTCENNTVKGRIKVTKEVVDEDDSKGGFSFELWNEDKTKELAKGISGDDGIVYWETGSGKNLAFFELPTGTYTLVEKNPVRYYGNTANEYTYKLPEGFTADGDGNWYKKVTVTETTTAETVTNDRCEGSIKITKTSEDGLVEDVEFDVYYGGKADEPKWEGKAFATGKTNGKGTLWFDHLPLGWYRIDEKASPEYKVVWDDGKEGISRTVRLTEKDDNGTLRVTADNRINITPSISTELTDNGGSHEICCGKNIELTDKVHFENLLPGLEYEITGSLIDSRTGEIIKDPEGNGYEMTLVFTPNAKNGTVSKDSKGREVVCGDVSVSFTVDSVYLYEKAYGAGEDCLSVVCFETLKFRGKVIAEHKDISDKDQTVSVTASISTTATDAGTGTGILTLSDTVNINDKVSFRGLAPGDTYVLTGTLMDKKTGAPYKDKDGKTYTSEVTFVPGSSHGYAVVEFKGVKVPEDAVDIVVFESLRHESGEKPIASHEDINDKDQTLHRPSCRTVATTEKGDKSFLVNTVVTVVDHVYYENLETGHKYYAKAELYLSDGTPVVSKGLNVVSISEFEPQEGSGTVDVTMKFDTSGLKSGDRVVVIENIYDKSTDEEISAGLQIEDVKVLSHEDLNNMDQSLSVTEYPISGETVNKAKLCGFIVFTISTGAIIALAVEKKRKKIRELYGEQN